MNNAHISIGNGKENHALLTLLRRKIQTWVHQWMFRRRTAQHGSGPFVIQPLIFFRFEKIVGSDRQEFLCQSSCEFSHSSNI